MLHDWQHAGTDVNRFRLIIRDMSHSEVFEDVISFVGEDSSGSFGIQANHARFITSLVYGLARFKQGDSTWRYLALPGAILYFADNEMTLNTRRFLMSDDYELISHTLIDVLAREEQVLSDVRHNLRNIENSILQRMLEISKTG